MVASTDTIEHVQGEIVATSMQSRLLLPILALSIVAVIVSAVQFIREQNRVYQLALATGSETGEYYAFGQAFATVVARHEPKIQIEVLATDGSLENMQLVADESVQLALVQSDTPVKPSVLAVAQLFPEIFHFIVAEDSDIQQLSDLKGKRIVLMPEGSGSYDSLILASESTLWIAGNGF